MNQPKKPGPTYAHAVGKGGRGKNGAWNALRTWLGLQSTTLNADVPTSHSPNDGSESTSASTANDLDSDPEYQAAMRELWWLRFDEYLCWGFVAMCVICMVGWLGRNMGWW